MAGVEWVKITTDMFDNRKIKHLRRLPDGNSIVLIWVMLLTMAGRCNAGGMIFLTENIPYTPKMLADELHFEENTVILALKALEQLEMVVTDGDCFRIAGWEEYQNVEGLDKIREQTRKRVAAYRKKQAALIAQMQCSYCGSAATGYDHIIATARGGADTEENKVHCCIECNRIKNDKPLVSFLNDNRERLDDGLIANNPKLQRFVTLCNVTGRYIVTQGNAIEEERETDIRNKNNNMGDSANTPERKRTARKPFSPPTVEEVRAYCTERGNDVDPEAFVDFYESKGWMIGKNRMKDWKAAVRTWEQSDKRKGVKNGGGNRKPNSAQIAGSIGLSL